MKVLILAGAFLAFYVLRFMQKKQKLNQVPKNVIRWYDKVNFYAVLNDVPADIAMAVLWVESGGDPDATGSAGEEGLFQLKDIAVRDIEQNQGYDFAGYVNDPDVNIQAGISFLKLQKSRVNSWPEAIKAYNQGVLGSQKNPGLAKKYLNKVNSKREFFG